MTYTLTESGLVDLNGLNARLLEVDNLVAEGKSKLLALELTRDIRTGEGPVENGDGAREHTLHGELGEALGVAAPAHSHGRGTADIRDNDRGTDVAEHDYISICEDDGYE